MIEAEIERRMKDHRLDGEPIEDAVSRLAFENRSLRNRLNNALIRISVVEVQADTMKEMVEFYRVRCGEIEPGYAP